MIALQLSLSDRADATVKIAISPVKNAFLREEIRESSSENKKKVLRSLFRSIRGCLFKLRLEELQHPEKNSAADQALIFLHHAIAQTPSQKQRNYRGRFGTTR